MVKRYTRYRSGVRMPEVPGIWPIGLVVSLFLSGLNHRPVRAQQGGFGEAVYGYGDSTENVHYERAPQEDSGELSMPPMAMFSGGIRGAQTAGGLGIRWRDRSRTHNVMLFLTFGVPWAGFFDDFGVQTAYLNEQYRFGFGGSTGMKTRRFIETTVDTAVSPVTNELTRVVSRFLNRIYIFPVAGLTFYPIDDYNWIELRTGVARYGFTLTQERVFHHRSEEAYREEVEPTREEQAPYYTGYFSAAIAGNNAYFGIASPVEGSQYRLHVAPSIGPRSYLTLLGDYRHYYRFEPLTLAVRGLHIGNYGADPDDDATVEYLGYTYYPGFIRGYSVRSFDTDECIENGTCAYTEHLQGTRIVTASLELRVPVLGPEDLGLVAFPYVPLELSLFMDAGTAWTRRDATVFAWKKLDEQRIPVFAFGVSSRVTVFGKAVVEFYYAYPFQRPDEGWEFSFRISPGW